jgi:hypothetical protein
MYPLRFHSEKAGAAHYLVELVAVRQAKRDGILLTMGFWRDPVWKIWYGGQIQAAQRLVNSFKEENIDCIVEAIGELTWLTSLRAKQLSELIYDKLAKKEAKKQKEKDFVAPKQEVEVVAKEVTGVRRKTKIEEVDL